MGDKSFSKSIAFFLVLLLSSYCIAFTDDELISVRVCGDALYGKNPCEWVKNIEVSVSYLGKDTIFGQKLTGLVENWVGNRIWLIPEASNVVVKEKPGWFYFNSQRENPLTSM